MVRVSALPTRKSVSGKTRMYQAHRRFHRGIHQVREKVIHLIGDQHSLVDDSAVGEAADVETIAALPAGIADRGFDAFANHVQLTFKRHVLLKFGAAADEKLSDY